MPSENQPDSPATTSPDMKYTAEHEWVTIVSSEDGTQVLRLGITAYAAEALGDIVFVTLPEVGQGLTSGEPFGEVESTKSVSDVYAPVAGTVVRCNDQLDDTPELVNSDPLGEGWLIELAPGEGVEQAFHAAALLSAEDYRDLTKG